MIVESDIVGVKRIMEVCQETVERTMPGKQCPVREAPGQRAEDILPQKQFVPWIVLGCYSMPTMLKFYV